MKREVSVEESVGLVLAHDLTQIIPGQYKGRIFKKGYVIQKGDIETLRSIGKEHLYVLEPEAGEIHEDDAASGMAQALLNESLYIEEVHEGKAALRARSKGLLRVKSEGVASANANGELLLVTKKNLAPVEKGETVAVARAIPLLIKEQKLDEFISVVKSYVPLLEVVPYQHYQVGVVTTGSEVLSGRIQDQFGPILKQKLSAYPVTWLGQTIVGDEMESITAAIQDWLNLGAHLVLVTGGMSVDPDDRTPGAIHSMASDVVTYGFPVLPGSMLMLAYQEEAVIMGLPGGILYDSYTSFDMILPRLLAGDRVTAQDVAELGYGGLLK